MKEPKTFLLRAGLVYVAVALLAVWIFISIIILQFNTSLKEKGKQTAYIYEEIDAHRGDILAYDGRVLVTSVPSYYLYLDPVAADSSVFAAEVADLAKALTTLFGDKTAVAYETLLRDARSDNKRYVRIGNRPISFSELINVQQFPVLKKDRRENGKYGGGCIAKEKNERKIFYDKMAFRTLGWQNEDGKYVGLEGSYDYALKGIPGKKLVEKTAGGAWIPVNNAPEILPRNGYDLVSTIDIDMQDAAENALHRQLADKKSNVVFEAGCVVVMEVKTGAIRAIANMKRNTDGSYSEDYNYAVGRATEPGSTFKLYTLLALLEDNKVNLNDMVATGNGQWSYSGANIKDVTSGGYGTISVQKIFEKSSNVGFAKLAVDNYKGNERQYVDKLYALKLNEKMNLQIPGEALPQVRYPGDKLWSGLSLPMMAMGYEVLLTPLKTLTVYNAVANNGKMMKPLFATELRSEGHTVETFDPEVISSAICSKKTLEGLRQALDGVVEHGTATNIRNPNYKIAGKTGTARIAFKEGGYERNGLRMYQASFAGFFPADDPKYSMVVVLYTEPTKSTGVYGAAWAAPVFKEIADKIYVDHPEWAEELSPSSSLMMSNLLAQNAERPVPEKINTNKVPSLIGMGLKDALFLLENQGLKVSFSGAGKVIAQSMAAGTDVVKGNEIYLELK